MRKALLLSTALLLGLGSAAMAQSSGGSPAMSPGSTAGASPSDAAAPAPTHSRRPAHRVRRTPSAAPAQTGDIRPGHEPGVGESYPLSGKASNITAGDSRSTIAPTLPSPAGGPNASVQQYLTDAQRALSTRQTGRAQEALERAETSMLQRSVPVDQANTPDQAPDVVQVRAAREALANNDMAGAKRAIDGAMATGR